LAIVVWGIYSALVCRIWYLKFWR